MRECPDMNEYIFEDRVDAGRQLAHALNKFAAHKPLIVGLPRGGVVVAAEVSDQLQTELDVLVSRKIGAPGQSEFAVGAVSAQGRELVDEKTLTQMGLKREEIAPMIEEARREARRQMERYRGKTKPDFSGRTVILVDDGLATGWTARAAVEAAREAGATMIVLAIPVGSPESVAAFQEWVQEVVCLAQPVHFRAVGLWYRNFGQTSDEEVLHLMKHRPGRDG